MQLVLKRTTQGMGISKCSPQDCLKEMWGSSSSCINTTECSAFLSCKREMTLSFKSTEHQPPVVETVYNLSLEISSEKKKGPMMKEAVKPHYTVRLRS